LQKQKLYASISWPPFRGRFFFLTGLFLPMMFDLCCDSLDSVARARQHLRTAKLESGKMLEKKR